MEIAYKNFKIKIFPADPNEEGNGKFIWEIWANYTGDGYECIGESTSINGFDKEIAIEEAKKEIDNGKYDDFFK